MLARLPALALVVLGARKLGYSWTAGETELRRAMALFVVAMVLQAISMMVDEADIARNFGAISLAIGAFGWLNVARATLHIGKRAAE